MGDRAMSALLRGARIAVVCQGLPHPTEGASVVLFYWYLDGLLRQGASVALHVFGPAQGGAAPAEPEWLATLRALGPITLHRHAAAAPIRHTLLGLVPDARLAATLCAAIDADRPELVLAFDWVAAGLLGGIRAPMVVWLGDLQFDTLLHHTHYALKEGSRRYDRLLLLGYRVGQLRRFYRTILGRAALVIVSSLSSEARLAELGVRSIYLAYPWPAAPGSDAHRAVDAGRPRYLFSGTLGALGSRSAFHMLLHQVLPCLDRAFGSLPYEVLLTGRGTVPAWAQPALAARPAVRMLGFVDDLAGLMASCTGFIAPIDVPVGNRSRILTAMAAGLPIVAHPNTSLGNPLLIDGETCHLAADALAFADRMVALARDPQAAQAMADRARIAYAEHHAPAPACLALARALVPILGGTDHASTGRTAA
jgi:glycosyltransferase involved in cell wall biosynthesis